MSPLLPPSCVTLPSILSPQCRVLAGPLSFSLSQPL